MNSEMNFERIEWIKSSYSQGDGGECLEFSRSCRAEGLVPVRDSKVPEGSRLVFGGEAWRAFLADVRR